MHLSLTWCRLIKLKYYKEVKYMIIDDCFSENLDPAAVLFMIISTLDLNDEFEVALQVD